MHSENKKEELRNSPSKYTPQPQLEHRNTYTIPQRRQPFFKSPQKSQPVHSFSGSTSKNNYQKGSEAPTTSKYIRNLNKYEKELAEKVREGPPETIQSPELDYIFDKCDKFKDISSVRKEAYKKLIVNIKNISKKFTNELALDSIRQIKKLEPDININNYTIKSEMLTNIEALKYICLLFCFEKKRGKFFNIFTGELFRTA